MTEYQHVCHTFKPVYDVRSKILILGSLPSVKSREQGFYYGHPRNRFWKVLAAVTGEETPSCIEGKKAMLLKIILPFGMKISLSMILPYKTPMNIVLSTLTKLL